MLHWNIIWVPHYRDIMSRIMHANVRVHTTNYQRTDERQYHVQYCNRQELHVGDLRLPRYEIPSTDFPCITKKGNERNKQPLCLSYIQLWRTIKHLLGFHGFHNATTKNEFTRTYHALCGQTMQWLDWFWRHNWSDFVLHWTDLHYFRTFGQNILTSKCPARANQTRARHLSLTAGGTSAEIPPFPPPPPAGIARPRRASRSQPRRRGRKSAVFSERPYWVRDSLLLPLQILGQDKGVQFP